MGLWTRYHRRSRVSADVRISKSFVTLPNCRRRGSRLSALWAIELLSLAMLHENADDHLEHYWKDNDTLVEGAQCLRPVIVADLDLSPCCELSGQADGIQLKPMHVLYPAVVWCSSIYCTAT